MVCQGEGGSGLHRHFNRTFKIFSSQFSTYLSISLVVISNKCKSPASSRASLQWNVNISNVSIFLKEWKQIIRVSSKGKISNSKTGHPFYVRRRATKARHFDRLICDIWKNEDNFQSDNCSISLESYCSD